MTRDKAVKVERRRAKQAKALKREMEKLDAAKRRADARVETTDIPNARA